MRFVGFIQPGKIKNCAFIGTLSDIAERWASRGHGSGPWWVYASGADAEALLKSRVGNGGIVQLVDGTWKTVTPRTMQEAQILCESVRNLAIQQKRDLRIEVGADGEAETIVREAVRGVSVGATSERLPGIGLRLPDGHKWAVMAFDSSDDPNVPEGGEAVVLLPVPSTASADDALRAALAGKE